MYLTTKYDYLNSYANQYCTQLPNEVMYFVTIQPKTKQGNQTQARQYLNKLLPNKPYVLQLENNYVTSYKTACLDGIHMHLIIAGCYLSGLTQIVYYKTPDHLTQIKQQRRKRQFEIVATQVYSPNWKQYLSKQINEYCPAFVNSKLIISSKKTPAEVSTPAAIAPAETPAGDKRKNDLSHLSRAGKREAILNTSIYIQVNTPPMETDTTTTTTNSSLLYIYQLLLFGTTSAAVKAAKHQQQVKRKNLELRYTDRLTCIDTAIQDISYAIAEVKHRLYTPYAPNAPNPLNKTQANIC